MGRPNLRYEGGRRPGIKGRVGYLRGSVIDANGGEVMRTRSAQLAGVIARALNGETVLRRSVEDPSPLARYTVSRGRRPSEYVVSVAESTWRDPAAFGDGPVAVSVNRELAELVAQRLNEIDPRSRRRITGWAG